MWVIPSLAQVVEVKANGVVVLPRGLPGRADQRLELLSRPSA